MWFSFDADFAVGGWLTTGCVLDWEDTIARVVKIDVTLIYFARQRCVLDAKNW
jgi:hypothetical protein